MFKALNYLSTYKAGLLQAKAYRVLKQHTALLLEEYHITTLDWAMLGILHDQKEEVRLSFLALELGVEAPLVTRMVEKLKEAGFINLVADKKDSRVRLASLSLKGKNQISIIEKKVRSGIKPVFKDISIPAMATYLSVLDKIVENGDTLNDGTFYS